METEAMNEQHPAFKCFAGVSFGQNVQIIGLANVSIGQGTAIGDDTWLNVCLRDDRTRLIIGRAVLVGRQSMLSVGGELEIGDFCLFAPRVFVSDADHVVTNIARPYCEQGFTQGKVVVEENCWLGINTVITGSITVGRGSVVAANAVVTRNVPAFSVVAGVPATILKMFNPGTNAWESATTPGDRDRIMEARSQYALPTREEYRFILHRTSKVERHSPLLVGSGRCL